MTWIMTRAPEAHSHERVNRPPLLRAKDGSEITDRATWEKQRAAIEADWRQYLGEPPFAPFPLNVRTERVDDNGSHIGTLLRLQTEPQYWEKCYLMTPKDRPEGPLPAVVVFYYDIDVPAGRDMGSSIWKEGLETRHFARHLVDRGYVVLVQRWVYQGKLEEQALEGNRYMGVVDHQTRTAPEWKGLGHVAWDASRCVDYLETLDFVDAERIGCMGHSLGGKMTLYAAAFDPRFKVAVSSEPGIGLHYCNWDAPWYLGPEVKDEDFGRDHHQLLALIAPRAFLLIGGESSDGNKSWPYLNAAQDVYRLYGAEDCIGMMNHGAGHAPTMEACEAAYEWFDRHL